MTIDDQDADNTQDPVLDELLTNPHWTLPDYRNISAPRPNSNNSDIYTPQAVLSATNQRSDINNPRYERGTRYIVEMIPLDTAGTSKVFMGYDQKMGRKVAIKALRPDKMADPRYVEAFEREAKMMAHVRDEKIVEVYDFQFGIVPGGDSQFDIPTAFIIMEFVDGPTLKSLFQKRKMSLDEMSVVLGDIAGALQTLADQDIMHRDLKPSNIFFVNGRAKLGDLGIASRVWTDEIFGTPAYLSPERIENPGEDFTEASEVFSLASIAYEMITKELFTFGLLEVGAISDFIGHTNGLRKFEKEIIDIKAEGTTKQKENLKRVLDKAHRRNPSDRYQTVAEFAQAFSDALNP